MKGCHATPLPNGGEGLRDDPNNGCEWTLTTLRRTNRFEIGVFTLKKRRMFSARTMLEKFENTTITSHFGIFFESNLGTKIMLTSYLLQRSVFLGGVPVVSHTFVVGLCKWLCISHVPFGYLFFKTFRYPVWRAFPKAPFSWQISVEGRTNRRKKKLCFQLLNVYHDLGLEIEIIFFVIFFTFNWCLLQSQMQFEVWC